MNEICTFRQATRTDVSLILRFIRDLARYEQLEHEVVATPALLEEWLFDKEKAEVLFAVVEGKEVGFALFFPQLFNVSGACRDLPGRSLCGTGVSRARHWTCFLS